MGQLTAAAARVLALAMVVVLGCCAPGLAAPGDMDRDFGGDGLIDVTVSGSETGFRYQEPVDMVVGPRDEIFVLVSVRGICAEPGPCDDLLIFKYGRDGQRDPGFSARFEPQARYLTEPHMTLDREGRIVVAAGSEKAIEVVRLRADGSRDTSFGVNGRVTLATSGTAYVSDLAMTADDEVVLLASVENGSIPRASDLAIARIQPNGGLDPRFGESGVVIYDSGGSDAGGRLAATGSEIAMSVRVGKKLRLVRFGQDGAAVATSTLRLSGRNNWSSGPILANPRGGAWITGLGGDGIAIAGFGSSWRRVGSFGTFGSAWVPALTAPHLGIDRAGRLVLAGSTPEPTRLPYDTASRAAVTRLLPSGRIDRTFAGGRQVWVPRLAFENRNLALGIQSDGRIVVLVLAYEECIRSCSPPKYFIARIRGGASRSSCHGRRATIVGTSRSETFAGTPHRDVVAALGGADTVLGSRGNDLICGGPGADALSGGRGRDRLLGGGGVDSFNGGPGRDRQHQ